MRHRHAARFVDHEAFDLAEHRRGAHAEFVAPVAISGAYDGERGFARLHHTDLSVRGVRTQEQAARQEEGVLHLTRGMVGREVERAEVMEVVLDVLRRHDFETHRGEDVEHPFEALRIPRGWLHPVTQSLERMLDIFTSMGFEVVATQDVEDDFHNFGALNFPPDHPAREMQDTFFLPGGLLLRTHTSNGQIRVMETRKPPLAIVCPGNCYRRDELSVRAAPMFSQIEGFMVDKTGRVTMAHLKGVLTEFLRAFFGPD